MAFFLSKTCSYSHFTLKHGRHSPHELKGGLRQVQTQPGPVAWLRWPSFAGRTVVTLERGGGNLVLLLEFTGDKEVWKCHLPDNKECFIGASWSKGGSSWGLWEARAGTSGEPACSHFLLAVMFSDSRRPWYKKSKALLPGGLCPKQLGYTNAPT